VILGSAFFFFLLVGVCSSKKTDTDQKMSSRSDEHDDGERITFEILFWLVVFKQGIQEGWRRGIQGHFSKVVVV
jgi:hypothetical protein